MRPRFQGPEAVAKREAQIKVERTGVGPLAPPTAAHKFLFTRVGAEIVLEVGFFQMAELREAVETSRATTAALYPGAPGGPQPPTVKLYISHQFSLSPQGVMDLISIARELEKDLPNFVAGIQDGSLAGAGIEE